MGLPIIPVGKALFTRAILPGLGIGAAQLGLGALTGGSENNDQPSVQERIADKWLQALKEERASTAAQNERAEARRAEAQAAGLGLSQQALEQQAALLQQFLDPTKYRERAGIDLDVYRQQAAIAHKAAMEQTRELTQRALERETINAWSNITQKEIDRDTKLAVNMQTLAATMGMPNPNVLQGMATAGASAAKAYSPVPALY